MWLKAVQKVGEGDMTESHGNFNRGSALRAKDDHRTMELAHCPIEGCAMY